MNDAAAAGVRDKWLMLLNNHGAVVCGKTIQDASVQNHFRELACRAQSGALAGGAQLIMPSRALCEERAHDRLCRPLRRAEPRRGRGRRAGGAALSRLQDVKSGGARHG